MSVSSVTICLQPGHFIAYSLVKTQIAATTKIMNTVAQKGHGAPYIYHTFFTWR